MEADTTMTTTSNYTANGKLLLSGEYYVLEGAKALALPVKYGQQLQVKQGIEGQLHWQSLDYQNQCWLEVIFELPQLTIAVHSPSPSPFQASVIQKLQSILQEAQKQDSNFLQDSTKGFSCAMHMNFPADWGLGSSSTLISCIAQWANINPFALQFATFGGSGYDIACALNDQAILYQKTQPNPTVTKVHFQPKFKDQLYFIHLNQKKNSREAIRYFYAQAKQEKQKVIEQLDDLTQSLLKATDLATFETHLKAHEDLIALHLQMIKVQDLLFAGYWGVVKSLGAWGGDFVLATSNRSVMETKAYFADRGFKTIFAYAEMVKEISK